ncbi:MAG: RpiB/LacA/LacB family sugar-phosphate isomerase [Oscillospiraceae bacterium]|nr:RpiB/LacA/LacB family sugar-phosphate isomerase [Oscillospiraceae bacterium]
MSEKTIYLGCDNAGFALKDAIISVLREMDIKYVNMGVDSADDRTYYPLIAERVAKAVAASETPAQGILLCGTGIGMAMTANKIEGIYAAVCHDNYSAERARLSNDGNVLCMGARIIGPELAKKVAREWLSLTFKDGSSTPKVAEMRRIDKENRA